METHFEKQHARTILVAEDDDTDFFFLQTAFEMLRLPYGIFRARNGHEAMDYLEGKGLYSNRGRWSFPELFILDLKMPTMDGFEVLAALKKSPNLSELPVVVLTGSNIVGDEKLARGLGARDFHMKPCGLQKLRELILQIQDNWLKHVHSPHSP